MKSTPWNCGISEKFSSSENPFWPQLPNSLGKVLLANAGAAMTTSIAAITAITVNTISMRLI
jgi:hypothetical protein